MNVWLLKRTALCVLPHTKPLTAAFPSTIMLSAHVLSIFRMCVGGVLLVRRDYGADLERTAEPCGKMVDSERIGSENQD